MEAPGCAPDSAAMAFEQPAAVRGLLHALKWWVMEKPAWGWKHTCLDWLGMPACQCLEGMAQQAVALLQPCQRLVDLALEEQPWAEQGVAQVHLPALEEVVQLPAAVSQVVLRIHRLLWELCCSMAQTELDLRLKTNCPVH